MNVRMVIGTHERHMVEAAYDPVERLFRVLVDGQEVYRHGGSGNGAEAVPTELRTGDRELHTLIVEPPGVTRLPRVDLKCYRLWLDGKPVAIVAAA